MSANNLSDDIAQIADRARLKEVQAAEEAANRLSAQVKPGYVARLAFALLHAALAGAVVELVRQGFAAEFSAYDSEIEIRCAPRHALLKFRLLTVEIEEAMSGPELGSVRSTWTPPQTGDHTQLSAWARGVVSKAIRLIYSADSGASGCCR